MRKLRGFTLFMISLLAAASVSAADDDPISEQSPLIIGLLDPRETLTGIARQAALETAQKELRFAADVTLFPPDAQNGHENKSLIDVWRERVYAKILSSYAEPRSDGADYCLRPDCAVVYDDPSQSESKAIRKVVAGETLRFARANSSAVDKLITAVRLDVSNTPTRDDPPPALTGMDRITKLPTKKEENKKDFTFQSRLRVKIDGGNVVPTIETQVRYKNISSSYRVNLHTVYDTRLGLQYLLATNVRLVLERETKINANPTWETAYQERTSQDSLRLVAAF